MGSTDSSAFAFVLTPSTSNAQRSSEPQSSDWSSSPEPLQTMAGRELSDIYSNVLSRLGSAQFGSPHAHVVSSHAASLPCCAGGSHGLTSAIAGSAGDGISSGILGSTVAAAADAVAMSASSSPNRLSAFLKATCAKRRSHSEPRSLLARALDWTDRSSTPPPRRSGLPPSMGSSALRGARARDGSGAGGSASSDWLSQAERRLRNLQTADPGVAPVQLDSGASTVLPEHVSRLAARYQGNYQRLDTHCKAMLDIATRALTVLVDTKDSQNHRGASISSSIFA